MLSELLWFGLLSKKLLTEFFESKIFTLSLKQQELGKTELLQ